jgi:hypothetical protein
LEEVPAQFAVVVGGVKIQTNDVGLDPLDDTRFTDLGVFLVIQGELDGQFVPHLEFGHAVNRKLNARLGDIPYLDQPFNWVAFATLKEKHPYQVHRLSKMSSALQQHAIIVPTTAFAFEPNRLLGLGELAQVSDDAVIAGRTDERAFSPVIDKDPVFFLFRRQVGCGLGHRFKFCFRSHEALLIHHIYLTSHYLYRHANDKLEKECVGNWIDYYFQGLGDDVVS